MTANRHPEITPMRTFIQARIDVHEGEEIHYFFMRMNNSTRSLLDVETDAHTRSHWREGSRAAGDVIDATEVRRGTASRRTRRGR